MRLRGSLPVLATFWLLAPLAGCGSSDAGEVEQPIAPAGASVRSIFAVPDDIASLQEETFFDHPWPSDARLDPDGTPHFAGWPNPRAVALLDGYIATVDPLLHGFSPAAAGWVRFDGAIDPATLPADPGATLGEGASVQLVDVDPGSPEHGSRRPVSLLWREQAGVYWPATTLSFMPTFGFPLRPATRYALVVTDALHGANGAPVRAAPALREVLGLEPASGAAATLHDAWAPAVAALGAAGIAPEHVAHLAVFTTDDPVSELDAVRDAARTTEVPRPDPAAWQVKEKVDGVYQVYEGTYGPSPDYQAGNVPFEHPDDGGGFVFDAQGKPILQRSFSLRFVLGVPDAARCPMPAAGYPIVLHAHGTGGNYRSHFRGAHAPAQELAKRCVASMGIDQIFHGTRPGAPTGPGADAAIELLVYNFQNPVAVRTNARQSAIDEVQRARLFTEQTMKVPAAIAVGGEEVRFDPTNVLFFGHSQGGWNGPLFLAIDDAARGGVLSGSASVLSITLLQKTEPQPSVAALVKTVFLALRQDEVEEVSSFHPAIALAQTIVDATDPIHYVARLLREPRAGFPPKSIYQSEGVNADGAGDSYSPSHGIEVQAVATGLPIQTPVIHPVEEARWANLPTVTIPSTGLAANLAGGKASGVLAQWPAAKASDGHFVVFDIPEAATQAAQFCRDLADDAHGSVPAP